jgi:archaemetzincin
LIFSCEKSKDNAVKNGEEITILIQPFEDVKPKQLAEISENIRKIYPKIKILEPIDFPKNTFYQPRNRYRADSIIKYLRTKTPKIVSLWLLLIKTSALPKEKWQISE